ncbi:GH43 family beta-xylosidase [Sphingomonas zeicaulis]|uniref:glycoside hydrolase family 43 protein n=1 Tax=Sphingomonas zeicaulis TaxID=1632740 RepID=UPI003D1DAFEA
MTFDLSRRLFLGAAAAATATSTGLLAAKPAAKSGAAPENPLVRQRADAQIFRHEDGLYYMTASVPEYDRLILRRSKTIAGLATAEEAVLWRRPASGKLAGYIWAPELHSIDGRWYMYFAAGDGGEPFRIRTYVLRCLGADPMSAKWDVMGQLETPWDTFTLDSTVFVHRGTRYICWAQKEPGIETNSNLYLAPLATPTTLKRAPTRLTVPTLPWEIRGFKVAEGAAPLIRNGRLFMTYSASATDARYCLGLLTAPDDADLMDPRVWTKSPDPVFVTSRETGVYGPGHNSFTVDEQGRDVLVYHGRDYEAIKGDPLFDPNRHTRVQRLYYRADGTPDFGIPVGNGALPERFAPAAATGRFLAQVDGMLSVSAAALPATQFRTLTNGGAQMLSPIERPDHVVAVGADRNVALVRNDGSADLLRSAALDREAVADGSVRWLSKAGGGALAPAAGGLGLVARNDPTARWKVT